jgi:hypothetical protein
MHNDRFTALPRFFRLADRTGVLMICLTLLQRSAPAPKFSPTSNAKVGCIRLLSGE